MRYSVQGPVVQSIVSLTSSLIINLLTVVANIFKYIDIFAAKMWVAFAMQKLLTFLQQKNINVFAIFQDRNFIIMLANNFVKFLTTGPSYLG